MSDLIHGIECLRCGCPARVSTEVEPLWSCPNCGGGFVRMTL